MRARDAEPLVVRRELVAGEREAGGVPADAQPRHAAQLEDRRVAVDPLLDADDVLLGRWPQVVRVADEQVPVGASRDGPGHDVAAPACVTFCRGSYQSSSIEAAKNITGSRPGGLRDAVELVDEPGQPRLGERPVLVRELALPLDRAAGGQVLERRGGLGVQAIARELPELTPDVAVGRGRDPDDVDAWRGRHDVSSSSSDAERVDVGVDVALGRRHRARRTGADDRFPHAAVREVDPDQTAAAARRASRRPRRRRAASTARTWSRSAARSGGSSTAGRRPTTAASMPSASRAPSTCVCAYASGVSTSSSVARAAAIESGLPNSVPPVAIAGFPSSRPDGSTQRLGHLVGHAVGAERHAAGDRLPDRDDVGLELTTST